MVLELRLVSERIDPNDLENDSEHNQLEEEEHCERCQVADALGDQLDDPAQALEDAHELLHLDGCCEQDQLVEDANEELQAELPLVARDVGDRWQGAIDVGQSDEVVNQEEDEMAEVDPVIHVVKVILPSIVELNLLQPEERNLNAQRERNEHLGRLTLHKLNLQQEDQSAEGEHHEL